MYWMRFFNASELHAVKASFQRASKREEPLREA
jgi:hypothetical protein